MVISFMVPIRRVNGVLVETYRSKGWGSNSSGCASVSPGQAHFVYVVEASAALLIEAASVSTYRLVSDRVISQPIPDSGPDTVRARVSRLPSGCGSTTCEAVTVTPDELDFQVYDGRPVGQLGDRPHRCG